MLERRRAPQQREWDRLVDSAGASRAPRRGIRSIHTPVQDPRPGPCDEAIRRNRYKTIFDIHSYRRPIHGLNGSRLNRRTFANGGDSDLEMSAKPLRRLYCKSILDLKSNLTAQITDRQSTS
jgi:hypothetical protein